MAAKINMRLDKNPMPSQDPNVRNKNFLEVAGRQVTLCGPTQ